jgi:hypothetical protein
MNDYWLSVRAQVAARVAQWTKGSEARVMYQELVEPDGWQERLMELAPDRLHGLDPSDLSFVILNNYFSRGFFQ